MAKNKIGLLGLSNTTLLLIGGGVALYLLSRKKNEPIQGISGINIKFKNVGTYLGDLSSRYEAIIDNKFKVWVYKPDMYDWKSGFRFYFLTLNNRTLDYVNDAYLANWYSNATKKEAYERVYEILNSPEDYDFILKGVRREEKMEEEYKKYFK
jgi:hypothetical protein